MQKFLPLIFITVLLNMLMTHNHLFAAVSDHANQPDNPFINQISDIPVQKTLLRDSSAAYTHVDHSLTDQKEKETWIREAAIKLNQLSGPADGQIIEKQVTDMEGFYQAGYRLHGSGYISFDNGEWIFLVSNSAHDDARIGDITIAIDNHQRMWINEGHICGGIIHFISGRKEFEEGAGNFFTHYLSDTDDKAWKSLCLESISSSFTKN